MSNLTKFSPDAGRDGSAAAGTATGAGAEAEAGTATEAGAGAGTAALAGAGAGAGPAHPDPTGGDGLPPGTGRRRRPRRLRPLLLSGGAVLALAGVGAAAVGIGGHGPDAPARSTLPPATATVSRDTLVENQEVNGSLGYGDTLDLAGRAAGTITWLPAAGARLGRGDAAFRVNNLPVVLLYGPLPMYRALTKDLKGPDVRQFEQNLWALGYRGFTVDDKYTESTAKAVRKWQKALGLTETGTVETSTALVVPGPIRVAERKVQVGDAAGGSVLTYTGTNRIVTIDLDVTYQQLVHQGAQVTVSLPSGQTTQGTIASVGAVATSKQGKDGSDDKSTIGVVVTMPDQKSLGTYDKAPVTIQLVANQRKDVLTVPVAALLALAEGGYGVQVVDGRSTRIVKVETGMFAGGKVEVRGAGIDVGTKVGMPT